MKTTEQNKILLGQGVLGWMAHERRSDRYGYVYLDNKDGRKASDTDITYLVGKRGRLMAKVVETRKSSHIGDFFRNIYPSTPNVGDEIFLSDTGQLVMAVVVDLGEAVSIGVSPDDGRETDWLDPKQLYKVHDQTVKLYFIEDENN